ncbi:hypothetical protein MA9V2_240 [Chryseobacterium phage MA9V-2]|nr:hypothetical protein MA9V2_240 [Chryseobacterium phage MA9V-2]
MNFNKNEAYGIGGENLTYKGSTSTANKIYHAFVNESGGNIFLTAEQINEATNGSADEEVYNQWAELLLQHIGVDRAKKYLNANDINKELKAMLDANHDMESDILYDKAMNAKLIAAVSRRRKAAGYVNESTESFDSKDTVAFISKTFPGISTKFLPANFMTKMKYENSNVIADKEMGIFSAVLADCASKLTVRTFGVNEVEVFFDLNYELKNRRSNGMSVSYTSSDGGKNFKIQ